VKRKGSKNNRPDFEEIQKALADEWCEKLKEKVPDASVQSENKSDFTV